MKLKNYLNQILLNKFEKKIIKNNHEQNEDNDKPKDDKNFYLFQIPMDYYYLLYNKILINEKK